MTERSEHELDRAMARLKRLGIVLPLAFLAALVVIGHALVPVLGATWAWIASGTLAVLGLVVFADWILCPIGALYRRLLMQHAELAALHEAGVAITADLDLALVLQRVIDEARRLAGARYGLLIVLDDQGQRTLFTSGYPRTARCEQSTMGEHGILEAVLWDDRPVNIEDLDRYPGTRRYPEGHPTMRSLLGMPIRSQEGVLGGLYLADREDGQPFDEHDRSRLERFAIQAALAIANARLHRRLMSLAVHEERERIAREMHDSLAQVLGYVITKVSALRELLRQPDRLAEAERHLEQLERAARDAYADVREAILGLRTGLAPKRSLVDALRSYVERWQDQSGVNARLIVDPSDGQLARSPADGRTAAAPHRPGSTDDCPQACASDRSHGPARSTRWNGVRSCGGQWDGFRSGSAGARTVPTFWDRDDARACRSDGRKVAGHLASGQGDDGRGGASGRHRPG